MIVEREQLFTAEDLTKEELFPNFIIVRRPINNETKDAGEWQGFIKDLKYTIRTSVAKSKSEIIQNFHSATEKINGTIQLNQKQNCANESIDEKLSNLKQQIDVQIKGLDSRMSEDMNFIKHTLAQLLQKQSQ
ncbi:UNKNOWN [Stylonychia lemnae]|uniref:Uncharacterized protein n=1 Tax=Stylonychia lemnae TaxID=5949 RepID=A0A077ZQE3_STYLE|nr:UNKNOWN [Stylonychia lemnae]|eukprot:CDW71684.1 UNKNOWN [Stylonychia lemnae]